MKGQWAPILSFAELVEDEQTLANDMIIEVDDKPLQMTRAPQASEHTEMVLMELGMEWDKIEDYKTTGAIA